MPCPPTPKRNPALPYRHTQPINNKSLLSRWSCASRHCTARQAYRQTCLDNKVNLLTFPNILSFRWAPASVFDFDYFKRSCRVCDCSVLYLSESFHCSRSPLFYFGELYNDLAGWSASWSQGNIWRKCIRIAWIHQLLLNQLLGWNVCCQYAECC